MYSHHFISPTPSGEPKSVYLPSQRDHLLDEGLRDTQLASDLRIGQATTTVTEITGFLDRQSTLLDDALSGRCHRWENLLVEDPCPLQRILHPLRLYQARLNFFDRCHDLPTSLMIRIILSSVPFSIYGERNVNDLTNSGPSSGITPASTRPSMHALATGK